MPMVLNGLNIQQMRVGLSFNMPKVLITGSLGLVGSEAMDFFREKGWFVVGIDSCEREKFFGVFQRMFYGSYLIDIRDEKTVNDLFRAEKFDAIIHTAGQPSHDYSKDHVLEDFDINARGTLILLEATRKYCPDAVFVFCSTDKVYGGNMQLPAIKTVSEKRIEPGIKFKGFDEELPIDIKRRSLPDNTIRSFFGCSKLAADLYVQEYGYYFGIKTVCFRLGCITGRRHKGAELHGFLAYLVKCIKEERPYKIFGFKGKQVRDQIHSYDLVNAMWHFIQNPKVAAVYNMGGGWERSVSILEAIEMIEKETGKKAIIEHHEPRKGDRNFDIHDVSKFKRDYPEWDYKYNLEAIIKDLCQS